MSIEFGNGNWYIDGLQADYISGVDLATNFESETVNCTYISPRFSADADMSFECACTLNNKLLQQLCYPQTQDKYTLETYIPIMIQARWHKKPRIRKKWLKRYGMKPDKLKLVMRTNEMSATPLDGYQVEAEIKLDDIKYEFRPDQRRRGIVWYSERSVDR